MHRSQKIHDRVISDYGGCMKVSYTIMTSKKLDDIHIELKGD